MTGKPMVGRVKVHYEAIDADPSDTDNNVEMVAGDDAALLERALEAADALAGELAHTSGDFKHWACQVCGQEWTGAYEEHPGECELTRYIAARKAVPNA